MEHVSTHFLYKYKQKYNPVTQLFPFKKNLWHRIIALSESKEGFLRKGNFLWIVCGEIMYSLIIWSRFYFPNTFSIKETGDLVEVSGMI